jgi:type II secretory pathway pseudopilin PulG
MVLRQRWRSSVRTESDAGFGMVELLFAMVVFTIIATAVAYGLQSAVGSTRQSRNRVQAASLASREVEIVRQEFQDKDIDGPSLIGDVSSISNPHPLKGQTAGSPLTIDGLPYTVTRSARWLPAGTGASACDGSSSVTYPVLAVNVKVTWPNMGTVNPVETNTLLTPKKEQVNGTDAYAAIKVLSAAGAGVPNMSVKLTNGATTLTAQTADDGCATFQVSATSTPVAYTASVTATGYVSNSFTSSATGTVSIKAGMLARTTLAYDKAVSLVLTQTTSGGYALPTQLVRNTIYSPDIVGGVKSYPGTSGGASTITGLWPSPGGYVPWPGACAMSDPSAAGTTRMGAVQIAGGGTGSATLVLTPVQVSVRNGLGVAVPGATVRAVPSTTTSCDTDNPLVLGTADSSGVLRTSLPAGTWTIQANGASASAATIVNATSTTKFVTVRTP